MAASWPTSRKSFTTKTNNVDTVDASHVNDLQDEVAAMQTSMGLGKVADVVQSKFTKDNTIYTDTTHIAWTSAAVTSSHGTEATGLATAITGKNTAHKFRIRVVMRITAVGGDNCTIALFKDSDTAPLATSSGTVDASGSATIVLEHEMAVPDTSAHTFKVRFGQPGSTTYTNSISAGTTIHDGKEQCSMTVEEIKTS